MQPDHPIGADLVTAPPGTVLWAKGFGSTMTDWGRAVAVDLAGNVYLAGGFTGSVDFNPGGPAKPMSSQGGMDAFVASYAADGTFRWVKQLPGSSGTDVAYGVAVDLTTVYVTGAVNGAPFLSATPTSSSTGSGWNKTLAAGGSSAGRSLALDAGSNLYLAGSYTTSVTPGDPASTLSAPGQSGFLASYTPAGVHLWSKSYLHPTGATQLRSVAVDGTAVWLAGTAAAAAGDEALLLRYTTSGGFVSALPLGAPATARGLAVAASGGAVYLAGSYTAGAKLTGSSGLTSLGKSDLFVRYALSTNLWAIGSGSALDDEASAIVTTPAAVHAVGSLGGPAPGKAGIFVGGWTKTGGTLSPWPLLFGSAGVDLAQGVALAHPADAIYVVGSYSSSVLSLGTHPLSCNGCTSNIYLAKIKL